MKILLQGKLVLASLCFLLIGCFKEDSTLNLIAEVKSAEFETFEAMLLHLNKVNAMDENDRRIYERQNNFKSLQTSFYEIYEGINMEDLEDKSELLNWVESNSNTLEVKVLTEEEYLYRPFYSNNPYSIIANIERMLIVGDHCVKIFDDGLITAPIEMYQELESITAIYVHEVPENLNFDFTTFNNLENSEKSGCGNLHVDRADNGRNRTRLTIDAFLSPTSITPYNYGPTGLIEIRPYMRTLGIWYYAQRTISGSISSNIHATVNGQPTYFSFNYTFSPTLSYVQTYVDVNEINPSFTVSNVWFNNFIAWGSTPSAGPAMLSCN